jgi:raffinose/stachyose/melibiose transport system permease protein
MTATLDRSQTTEAPEATRRRSGPQSAGALPYLLLLPGLAFYVAFVLVPIVATVRLSFFRWNGLGTPTWVGLDNYDHVLNDPRTWEAFKVGLVFVGFGCVLPVLVALLLVGLVVRTKVHGLSFFRFLYFLPYTIALAVVGIAWRWLYALNGSLNEVLRIFLGGDFEKVFLGERGWALPSLGVVAMWGTFGFVLVMLMSGAQHIPRELYDAARVDGAGAVSEFFAVTLPGIKYELRVALVMTFIMSMRMFDLPLIMTGGGPGYETTTPAVLMYNDVFKIREIGPGSVISVLLTVAIFVGVLLINRAVRTEDES